MAGSRRVFNGQIHLRLSPAMHEKIAKEAIEKGISMSGIIAEAVSARNMLKEIDPWKTVEEIWEANRGVDQRLLEKNVADSIRAVRKKNRRR